MNRRAGQQGYTLVELMVTLAILGVVGALAVQTIRRDSVGDEARQVNALLSEARRIALAGGPIRPDVQAATGIRARARLTVSTISGRNRLVVEVLREDALPAATASWTLATYRDLTTDVIVYGTSPEARPFEGGTITDVMGPTDTFQALFFADGTVDAMTLFLGERRDPTVLSKSRIFIYPLSGRGTVYKEW